MEFSVLKNVRILILHFHMIFNFKRLIYKKNTDMNFTGINYINAEFIVQKNCRNSGQNHKQN